MNIHFKDITVPCFITSTPKEQEQTSNINRDIIFDKESLQSTMIYTGCNDNIQTKWKSHHSVGCNKECVVCIQYFMSDMTKRKFCPYSHCKKCREKIKLFELSSALIQLT